ncbi:MAG TPA: hypothetical protein PLQ52_02010 [Lacunisphaera sp.]|jgi:hypothetical protein|nr:hypothetical protein [Lacunisphaera sp.]
MQTGTSNTPFLPEVEVIQRAIEEIESFVTDRSRSDWTQAVKKSFTKLGLAHHWGICANVSIKHEDVHKEWLFDLTWFSSPENRLNKLGLVLESEWEKGIEAIKYDFEKLLIARAPYKVVLFDATDMERPRFINELKEIVRGYSEHAANEVYFLAAYNGGRFVVDIVRPGLT